ncbi:hypothetical protein HZF05_07350 [Sphingomonas sp. CGMCC 1.13654]|uniref:Uncharacterized protein n=1 Tax=Sphingomonas chungangi TaxID=2683589 RepID=A0A838L5E7_9SPHN|nr:hypothetical protein [Sphingomonas chungangi]MBA2933915.1 hypothetical protein [Sphingomonas chungangi]MVW55244.1 hypothetical protein [Sphingomonas chungangi]
MMMTPIEEFAVAAHMRALMSLFEGEGPEHNRILYQAVIGFDVDLVGRRCREIDAADADGVIAIFDPDAIMDGPLHVGICMRDREMVRLDLGQLWMGRDPRAVLVANRGHFKVEDGRFVERPGKPTADLTRGKGRARRRLAELVSIRCGDGVVTMSID